MMTAAVTPDEKALAAAAGLALFEMRWADAALLFTAAADVLALDVHGKRSSEEARLRRSAHLALCRTREFIAYRENMRSRVRDYDPSNEYTAPNGDLVHRLLGARTVEKERTVVRVTGVPA